MNETLKDLAEYIMAALGAEVVSYDVARGELTLTVRGAGLLRVLSFLRDDSNCQFRQLIDVAGVDYPDREARFDVVYHLLSLKQNQRLRVKVEVGDGIPVPSATPVFSSAGWWERETWDLYGILQLQKKIRREKVFAR